MKWIKSRINSTKSYTNKLKKPLSIESITNYLSLKTLLLLVVFYTFTSCERDDICPPDTSTTPFLIIQFFDTALPDENKNVQSLAYSTDGVETFSLGTTDSIALPLNTNANATTFTLISNNDNSTFTNADEVEFIYQVDDVYINRACGFKANFSNLSAIRTIEPNPNDNWIKSIVIEQINVENEQNTHVFIFH